MEGVQEATMKAHGGHRPRVNKGTKTKTNSMVMMTNLSPQHQDQK